MSHEAYRRTDGNRELCGVYFLFEGGTYSSYCECPLADDPDKACCDIVARKKYGDIWRTPAAEGQTEQAAYEHLLKNKRTGNQVTELDFRLYFCCSRRL